MISFFPTRIVEVFKPFQFFSAFTDTPYLLAIPDKVSPRFIRYTNSFPYRELACENSGRVHVWLRFEASPLLVQGTSMACPT